MISIMALFNPMENSDYFGKMTCVSHKFNQVLTLIGVCVGENNTFNPIIILAP